MPRNRTDFSPKTKAQIFRRDRGTCAFTGACCWILDHGATWLATVDWVDHVQPSTKQGPSTLDNGVCASWKANQRKSANGRDKQYWFRNGYPTAHFIEEGGVLSPDLIDQLKRLANLQPSDWYFNKALHNLLLAFARRYFPNNYDRNFKYYCEVVLSFLAEWRKALKRDEDEDKRSMEARGVLKRPLTKDMRLMLDLRNAKNLDEVERLAGRLGPIWRANYNAFHAFLHAATNAGRLSVLLRSSKHSLVSTQVIKKMRSIMKSLDPSCGRLSAD
jgi:hypothetical protein